MKKCFICFEELEGDFIKLCSCEESYIHLRYCYEKFTLYSKNCPVCRKELTIQEEYYYDWFYLWVLIKKTFFILYVPFILFIFPILYCSILSQNNILHYGIFFIFIFGNLFLFIFHYHQQKNKYVLIYPDDGTIESNSDRVLANENCYKKLIYHFKIYIFYYTFSLILGIILDKFIKYSYPSFITLTITIFTLPSFYIIYKCILFIFFRLIPTLFKCFCLSIGVLKRKPQVIN